MTHDVCQNENPCWFINQSATHNQKADMSIPNVAVMPNARRMAVTNAESLDIFIPEDYHTHPPVSSPIFHKPVKA